MLRFAIFLLLCLPRWAGCAMSLEEKIGQLLLVHFRGEVVNEDARFLIHQVHVGGFLYYTWANGLSGPEQVLALSEGLQRESPIPLLVAVDQEGGRVCRLREGFTPLPAPRDLAAEGAPSHTQECAYATGKELQAVGVHLNLAPVVDIDEKSDRSFGQTADTVIRFGRAFIEGMHRAGVAVCLKHFPGHGGAPVDSHLALPVLCPQAEALLPFAALGAQADAVMTGHLLIPSLDPERCATLSPAVLRVLRQELQYEGLIISDSLIMQGLIDNCPSLEEAALQALLAGCDMLILGGRHLLEDGGSFELTPNRVAAIHVFLVQAVREGRLSEERVDDAVRRIKRLKRLRIARESAYHFL
jgi:beta-N-acetylhexosaminidase